MTRTVRRLTVVNSAFFVVTFLGTAEESGTAMSRVPVALNRWAGIESTYFPKPSAKNLKAHAMYEIIAHDKAVVYGTRELAGSSNSHDNLHYKTFQIDHIIAEAPHRTRTLKTTSMANFVAPWGVVA